MNRKSVFSLICTLVLVFSFTGSIAQEKTKKQLKEEKKLEKQNQTSLLVNSKEFVFEAKMMVPQGARSVVLTDYYAVEFHLDSIKSDLPFFGRGFSGIGYGGDSAMRFEGKPEKFSIEKTKKAYVVKTEVKTEQDYFSLLLSVNFDGSAYLSITSNNRSSISYNGDIKALDKK